MSLKMLKTLQFLYVIICSAITGLFMGGAVFILLWIVFCGFLQLDVAPLLAIVFFGIFIYCLWLGLDNFLKESNSD